MINRRKIWREMEWCDFWGRPFLFESHLKKANVLYDEVVQWLSEELLGEICSLGKDSDRLSLFVKMQHMKRLFNWTVASILVRTSFANTHHLYVKSTRSCESIRIYRKGTTSSLSQRARFWNIAYVNFLHRVNGIPRKTRRMSFEGLSEKWVMTVKWNEKEIRWRKFELFKKEKVSGGRRFREPSGVILKK